MSTVRRINDSRGREWKVYIQDAGEVAAAATTDNAIGNVIIRMERSDERHFDLKLRGRAFAQMSDDDLVAELEKELTRRKKAAGGS